MTRSAASTVRGVQSLLSHTSGRRISVDGIVGQQTLDAYNATSGRIRNAIDAFVTAMGFDSKTLFAPIRRVTLPRIGSVSSSVSSPSRASGSGPVRWPSRLSPQEMLRLVAHVRSGLPASITRRLDFLKNEDIVDIMMVESRGKVDAVAPSGLFHGLTQMGAPAWKDAQDYDPRNHKLMPFRQGRHNPVENLRAAFSFWASLVRSAPNFGYRITNPVLLYAAHQQGASGLGTLAKSSATLDDIRNKRTGRTVVDGQSRESLVKVASAVEDIRRAA